MRLLVAAQILAGAEVGERDAPAGAAHDVVRLDVAVQGIGAVHRRQRPAQVHADEGGFVGAERAALRDERVERLARDQLHGHADLVADPVGAEHPHHVGMIDARQRFAPRSTARSGSNGASGCTGRMTFSATSRRSSES